MRCAASSRSSLGPTTIGSSFMISDTDVRLGFAPSAIARARSRSETMPTVPCGPRTIAAPIDSSTNVVARARRVSLWWTYTTGA